MDTASPSAAAEAEPDYYAVLGVSPTVEPDELRRAYGEAAKTSMSDRTRFEAVGDAFEVLKDPAKRAAYDRRRRLAAQSAQPIPTTPPTAVSAGTARAPIQPTREPTRMGNTETVSAGATLMGGATIAMPPSSGATIMGGSNGGDRTQAFILPTVCAINLSPCPLLSGAQLPDEGFCAECGVLVGTPLGEMAAQNLLPKLIDATGREFPLKSGENVVGREGADVMLPDKTVSRRHARLIVANGTVVLEDTGSTNGTKRAGQPVVAGQRVTLTDQTPVQFGSVKLTITIPFDPNAAPMLALPLPGASEKTEPPLRALAAPTGAETAAARLVAQNGTVHPLTAAKTTFGRKSGNLVVITGDSFVSGNHAEILYESERYRLVDVGSTNGTKLNGRKLVANEPQLLSDGDEVVLGQTPFTFRLPGK